MHRPFFTKTIMNIIDMIHDNAHFTFLLLILITESPSAKSDLNVADPRIIQAYPSSLLYLR